MDFSLINQTENLETIREQLMKYNIQDCRVLWYVLANYAKTTVDRFTPNQIPNRWQNDFNLLF
jgi:hypothetical protein